MLASSLILKTRANVPSLRVVRWIAVAKKHYGMKLSDTVSKIQTRRDWKTCIQPRFGGRMDAWIEFAASNIDATTGSCMAKPVLFVYLILAKIKSLGWKNDILVRRQ
jgi:hypothetical protein